jgi:hypothetical protein
MARARLSATDPTPPLREQEHWDGLRTHYLFGAIPVGGNQ